MPYKVKKSVILLIIILATFFMYATCGRGQSNSNGLEYYSYGEQGQQNGKSENGDYITHIEINDDNHEHGDTQFVSFTSADFLYDFDYMIAVLEANFPSFGIIYRLHGVDMLEVARDLRDSLVERSETMDFEGFWNMLRDEFFYYAGNPPVGHLQLFDDVSRQRFIEAYEPFPGVPFATYVLDILNSPPEHPSYPYVQTFTQVPEPPPGWQPGRVLLVDTNEEERIGYLRYYTLWREPSSYEIEMLAEFFRDIADFEHLILDIRSCLGGSPTFFDDHVTRYLISDSINLRHYHFWLDGDHNLRFFRAAGQTLLPISDQSRLFPRVDISDYVREDIAQKSYRFSNSRIISPWPEYRGSQFSGEIWLLIDSNVYSASMHVAASLKESGVVTLVGETTGGGASTPFLANYIALPNTGIIIAYDATFVTDVQGRPLEYGVEPHHFNFPGMDAMETVMALIAAGQY